MSLKLVATLAIVGTVLGNAQAISAARLTHSTRRPIIKSISATRSVIPTAGGRVVVRVNAVFGKTCVFSGAGDPLKIPCSDGSAAESITFNANSSTAHRVWTIYVICKGPGGTSLRRHVTITQSGAAPVVVHTPPTPTVPVTTTTTPVSPTAALLIGASSVPSTGGAVTLTYSSTNASTCTLASTPAFWPGADPMTVNCNGAYPTTVQAATSAQQWTFTFTAATSSGQTATISQILTQLAPPLTQSPNWSGYVVPSSSLVTDASGAWTVPTLNCSDTPNAREFTWVGIGGYGSSTGGTSGTLLQTGTIDQCVNGSQEDSGWFEEYPSTPNESVTFANFPVSPGDSIAASVFQTSGGAWETRVDDLTKGLSGIMVTEEGWGVASDASSTLTFSDQGSTAGLTYSGGYTAEWIVEDPTVGLTDSLAPFANYGTVTFRNLQTILASWSLTTGEGDEIVQNGVTLSTPSVPSTDGFSVSYTGP